MSSRLLLKIATSALLVTGVLTAPATAAGADTAGLDRQELRRSLDAVVDAGMYGIYSHVRDGSRTWKGASGVADTQTRRPVSPDMVHRVGSITKTFTAVAVLRQVARGTIDLDAPIGRYLPDLFPDDRGDRITVRMILNHTSHIANHTQVIFTTVESLEENRFRRFAPAELARIGLDAPPTGEPGATPGVYSNTNYVIAGLLLEKVTGQDAEQYITRDVIRRAGLRHTSFPRTPVIPGPHSKGYESLLGTFDPPRDFSVYDMSWAGTAGALVSTMEDLDQFYRALFRGKLLGAAELAEMQKTVPVLSGSIAIPYGLGLLALDLPCGRFWGHTGGVWGMTTQSLTSADGERQNSFGVNLANYQTIDENGVIQPSPIDYALADHTLLTLCGPDSGARAKASRSPLLLPRLDGPAARPATS
ncbi:serine hydrolase domain-containing protein [Nonomuraea jiangxiensis]|uniref:D-alanyl-D-alanine carboxypeptidase n=1 Tax=Nonomuraea jiangxiensis TaxID=633440 RepID=A0A1G7ZCC4_9ACTN|nr:serine hydrolase domain-containing protein [Nonomuraea jiangxiensis]SDH06403.1 D-alanyl-D-alanine carboxypeptidase [Nonomuraea jiangxiensis]